MKALVIKYGLIALISLGVLGGIWYHGFSAGVEREQGKLLKAKTESQETINALSSETEQLRQEIQRLQYAAPSEIVRYVETRGSDPECFDANGLSILERYRRSPGQPDE